MPVELRELKPGDELTAEWLNALADLVRRCDLSVDGAGGLSMVKTATGTAVSHSGPPEPFWAEITYGSGSSSAYSWASVAPAAGGAWASDGRRGYAEDDPEADGPDYGPAIEVNGLETVEPGTVVLMHGPSGGRYAFLAWTCEVAE